MVSLLIEYNYEEKKEEEKSAKFVRECGRTHRRKNRKGEPCRVTCRPHRTFLLLECRRPVAVWERGIMMMMFRDDVSLTLTRCRSNLKAPLK